MTITIETGITFGAGMVIGDVPILTPRNYTIQANGNAQISTSLVKFGTGSFTSLASPGYLNITPFSPFAFGTGDFTIEFWYYAGPTTATAIVFGTRPSSGSGNYPVIFMSGNRQPLFSVNGNTVINTSASIISTAWVAISLVRYQGVSKMYINGVQTGTIYTDTNNYLAGSCVIGGRDIVKDGTFFLGGNLDEFRISNIARYTGNYTPATQPFANDPNTLLLLHCDGTNGSTTFLNSSNVI
jgi:hypothetical protein